VCVSSCRVVCCVVLLLLCVCVCDLFLFDPFSPLIHTSRSQVRLSDFGLSKVMDHAAAQKGGGSAMELTSYGSGTHGYLPPECYEGDASRICPKVPTPNIVLLG